MRIHVTAEYYRVSRMGAATRWEPVDDTRYHTISVAVAQAMRLILDGAGSLSVERVTEHEPCPVECDAWLELLPPESRFFTETVTGRVNIPGPHAYDMDPRLSRYHAVNGWVIPETIDPDEPPRL